MEGREGDKGKEGMVGGLEDGSGRGQWVTVKNAVMIWKVMVQSVLDYATEVFGGMERWEEAERVAGRWGERS